MKSEVWKLIDIYFKDNPQLLVKHHIDSYNSFIKKGIPKIFKENNPIVVMKNRIDGKEVYSHEIRVYMGGRNGTNIKIGKPVIYDDNNNIHYMYPNEARLRNMTYGCSIHYDATVDIIRREVGDDGKINETVVVEELTELFLTRIPVMLQSNYCILKGIHKMGRYHLGECKNDPGGYFIVDGKEKVIVSQEVFGNNLLYVRDKVNDVYSHSVDVRTVSEDPSKPKRTLSIRMVAPTTKYTNKQIVVFVPNVRKPIPLFILMRALGVISDKEIIETCLLDLEKEKDLLDLFIPSIHDAGTIFTRDHAIRFIGTFVKNQNITAVMNILSNYLLPNIGECNYLQKAYVLGHMVKKMLDVYVKRDKPTDRDSFRYKRVEVSGMLMYDLFQEFYKIETNSIRTKIDKEYKYDTNTYNKDLVSLIKNNYVTLFKEDVVHRGMKKAFKGKWGSQSYTTKDGIVQDLNRLSFFSFIEHMRKLNLNMNSSAKVIQPRYLHSTHYGVICPVHTPDGGNVGFHKHMAIGCYVTSGTSARPLIRWLHNNNLKFLEYCSPKEIHESIKIFVNGNWIGIHSKPIELQKLFRVYRRNGLLSSYTNVYWDIQHMEMYFATDSGRITRPLFYVDNETGESSFRQEQFMNLCKNRLTWREIVAGKTVADDERLELEMEDVIPLNDKNRELLKNDKHHSAIVEYLDTMETEGSYVAMADDILMRNHTHQEIHPSLTLSVLGNMIIFPEHNQLPRNLFSCGQSKQAVSLYSSNYRTRMDTMGVVLHYGQNPIVRSRYLDYVTHNEHPYGENVMVAIMCYSGYNVEDALIFNRASVERGMFRTNYFKLYVDHEEREKVNDVEIQSTFMDMENKDVIGQKPGYDYSSLDKRGIVEEGTFLDEKKIIIGKTFPSMQKTGVYVDVSTPAKKGQIGVVDKSFVTDGEGEDTTRIAKVRVREERIPSMGDKFCSRAGQKGTIGIILDEEDMPFTEDGIRPDVIMNPHAIPSRMTIGHLVECIIGKACLYQGTIGDCTAFNTTDNYHKEFKDILHQAGYQSSGNQVLYNGITGEQVETDVFFGPNYYLRLKHMVKDKINYRARGPRTALTRQTVQGRANDGGLRIGEMERDCLIAHGMSGFIRDSMMERGDKYKLAICNTTGMIAVWNELEDIFYSPYADGPLHFDGAELKSDNPKARHVSKYGRSYSIVEVPYSFKLFMQELATMNIHMRIVTEDNIEQLETLAGKDDAQFKKMTGFKSYEALKNEIQAQNGVNESLERLKSTDIDNDDNNYMDKDESEYVDKSNLPKQRIAIIVPFKREIILEERAGQNRAQHLEQFVKHMRNFIGKMAQHSIDKLRMQVVIDIYVVEQYSDEYGEKFNRGALLNSGFKIAMSKHDYISIMFHDVDLLPNDEMVPFYLKSLFIEDDQYSIIHLAHTWKRYKNYGERFIGGVTIFKTDLFREINGYPTYFEGWGGEDEALLRRIENIQKQRNIPVNLEQYILRPEDIPKNAYIDLENIDTVEDKTELMREHNKLHNTNIQEGLDLDSVLEVRRNYGVETSSLGELYTLKKSNTLQNQSNIRKYLVDLNRDMTSYDIVEENHEKNNIPRGEDFSEQDIGVVDLMNNTDYKSNGLDLESPNDELNMNNRIQILEELQKESGEVDVDDVKDVENIMNSSKSGDDLGKNSFPILSQDDDENLDDNNDNNEEYNKQNNSKEDEEYERNRTNNNDTQKSITVDTEVMKLQ